MHILQYVGRYLSDYAVKQQNASDPRMQDSSFSDKQQSPSPHTHINSIKNAIIKFMLI